MTSCTQRSTAKEAQLKGMSIVVKWVEQKRSYPSRWTEKPRSRLSSLGYIPGSEGNISLKMCKVLIGRIALQSSMLLRESPGLVARIGLQPRRLQIPQQVLKEDPNESFSLLHAGQAIHRSW